MIRNWKERKWLAGAALFALSALFLYWVAGDILHMFGDEGIYLQGGRLVASGRQPYRDFFAIAGPLTFWMEGLLAWVSGASAAVMRLPLIADIAFLVCAVYYLLSRYTSVAYAAGTAVAFLAYSLRMRQINVNHRWDSAALAMGAILLASRAKGPSSRWTAAAAGLLMAAASFATPSMAVAFLPLLVWCWGRGRRDALFLVGGAVLAAAAGLGYLQSEHALVPMIESMRWNSVNYSQANRVAYGGLSLERFSGGSTAGWQGWLSGWIGTIPAIAPPIAMVAWLLYGIRQQNRDGVREMLPFLAAAAALVFSNWPHWTSNSLLFTLALSWFLCALLFYRLTTVWQRRWFCLAVLAACLLSLGRKGMAAMDYAPRETRVGDLRASAEESEFLNGLERWVQPGDSLFSYPYMPSLYYFLRAQDPTYYTYLQPGMMTAEDERRAIRGLEAAPPRWLVYENFPPEAVLQFWPGSDPARLTMGEINAYLHAHFHQVDVVSGPWGRVVVMENNSRTSAP